MTLAAIRNSLSPLVHEVDQFLHTPKSVGILAGISLIQGAFDPWSHHREPDVELKERYNIVEIDQDQPSQSTGSTYLKGIKPVILMKAGLKEVDPDAYQFFLQKEIYLINSSRAILQPLASTATAVALAALVPVAFPFWATLLTWIGAMITLNSVASNYFESRAEKYALLNTTEEQKKGAARIVAAAKMHGQTIGSLAGKLEEATLRGMQHYYLMAYGAIKNTAPLEAYVRPAKEQLEKASPDTRRYYAMRVKRYRKAVKDETVMPMVRLVAQVAAMVLPFEFYTGMTALVISSIAASGAEKLLHPLEMWNLKSQLKEIDREVAKPGEEIPPPRL